MQDLFGLHLKSEKQLWKLSEAGTINALHFAAGAISHGTSPNALWERVLEQPVFQVECGIRANAYKPTNI
jgi:hypothetical protein